MKVYGLSTIIYRLKEGIVIGAADRGGFAGEGDLVPLDFGYFGAVDDE